MYTVHDDVNNFSVFSSTKFDLQVNSPRNYNSVYMNILTLYLSKVQVNALFKEY